MDWIWVARVATVAHASCMLAAMPPALKVNGRIGMVPLREIPQLADDVVHGQWTPEHRKWAMLS